jgi:hypothetical protein
MGSASIYVMKRGREEEGKRGRDEEMRRGRGPGMTVLCP